MTTCTPIIKYVLYTQVWLECVHSCNLQDWTLSWYNPP